MKLKKIRKVIVQAGGKGTRLEYLTSNKPKCLLSVNGKPLLYHLFDAFPHAEFVVIGDYLYEVLEAYMAVMPPPVPVKLIRAEGKGTIASVAHAIRLIKSGDEPFLLVWADLLFEGTPDIDIGDNNIIGLSRSFPCTWSCDRTGALVHKSSRRRGVAGFFVFKNKEYLKALPAQGDLATWLAEQQIKFDWVFLDKAIELGTLEAVTRYQDSCTVSRFFNSVVIKGDRVIKQARIKKFDRLIAKEVNWYRSASSLGFKRSPALLSAKPMTLERIHGKHPFDIALTLKQKELLLYDIFRQLDILHNLKSVPADRNVMREVYLDKTLERVRGVASLIPDMHKTDLLINGCRCINPFHKKHIGRFRKRVKEIHADNFVFLHGDPTFSNILVDRKRHAQFIDPRGYFGSSLLYGDPLYDWSKLYYSVVGNYDSFNQRHFSLKHHSSEVRLNIRSNHWEIFEPLFEEKFGSVIKTIRLIHALIWISLCGYVNDDYDSILGAFYNGLFWLEKAGI